MWFFRSPSIIYGEDSLSFLNNLPCSRILIITDRNIVSMGLAQKVIKELPEGSESMIIGNVPVEPTMSFIRSQAKTVNEFRPDLIIGLGGGSSMDCAKACFVSYERPDLDLYEITPMVNLDLRKKAKLVLIPTTSGTGSECSWASVISEDDHKRKNELASPEIIADYAVLDPEMVKDLPWEIRRSTAVDALTHAVEGYTSAWKNPYSDIFSRKAVELITHNLPFLSKGEKDMGRIMDVHMGASMAGLSFSNSQITLAHSLGHSLGAMYRVPHGICVGIFLPYVIEFNYPESGSQYDELISMFPEEMRRKKLDGTVREFYRIIGMPTSIEKIGIKKEEYLQNMETLVSLAMESTGTTLNPRETGRKEMEELFMKVIK